jgi:hypothetical protein
VSGKLKELTQFFNDKQLALPLQLKNELSSALESFKDEEARANMSTEWRAFFGFRHELGGGQKLPSPVGR